MKDASQKEHASKNNASPKHEPSPVDQRKPITAAEVRQAFEPLSNAYPPILFLKDAAILSGYTEGTLKKKLSEGCFRNSVSRGKPLRFWRDRFVLELMNKPMASKPLHAGQQEDDDEVA